MISSVESSSMLKIEKVDQSFRAGFFLKPKQILHGIEFEVPKGSIFGFLGPNGAGKTTLIHLIVGIRQPKSGAVRLNGHLAHSSAAKASIGYLPERPYFYEHLTGEQFLRFFGDLSQMPAAQLRQRIPIVLDKVGMSRARDLELKKFSKGMLQRIGIAQAILHEPELLVLDEPMSGLDPSGRREIRELILELNKEGRTIFFSSHVIPDVEAICDRVAVIRDGRLVESGTLSELRMKKASGVEITIARTAEAEAALKKVARPQVRIELLPDAIRVLQPETSLEAGRALLQEFLSLGLPVRNFQEIGGSLEDFFFHA